ncbi:hypothetical protein BMS3Bbin04_00305 [bacterium BMS3Bbin04]|nr:hypothetical protein BMS3Bbin04_00305 [bacterium BMS3Bbin04]
MRAISLVDVRSVGDGLQRTVLTSAVVLPVMFEDFVGICRIIIEIHRPEVDEIHPTLRRTFLDRFQLLRRNFCQGRDEAGDLDVNRALAIVVSMIDRFGLEHGHLQPRRRRGPVLLHDFAWDLNQLQLDARLHLQPLSYQPQLHLEFPRQAVAFLPTSLLHRLGNSFGFLACENGIDAVHVA